VRKSASIRLGLLLAASALLSSCRDEPPPERRCVDGDGKFADESLCVAEATPPPDGGTADGATGTWGETGPAPRGGGYHFIWIPYGSYGGVGTYAAGFQRGTGSGGAATSGSVTRGGFGATGAAHASPGGSAGGHAGSGS
jgi:hypothetical protein